MFFSSIHYRARLGVQNTTEHFLYNQSFGAHSEPRDRSRGIDWGLWLAGLQTCCTHPEHIVASSPHSIFTCKSIFAYSKGN